MDRAPFREITNPYTFQEKIEECSRMALITEQMITQAAIETQMENNAKLHVSDCDSNKNNSHSEQ